MKIMNNAVCIEADYECGIRAIERNNSTQSKIINPGCSARFSLGKKVVAVECGRPDALSEEPGQIIAHYSHKFGELANKRVDLVKTVTVTDDAPYAVITAKITNSFNEPIHLQDVTLLDVDEEHGGNLVLGYGVSEWSFYKHGFQSFSASGTMRAGQKQWRPALGFLRAMEENPTNINSRRPDDFISEQVTQITNCSSGQSLLVGFLTGERTFGDIRLVTSAKRGKFHRLIVRNHFDGYLLNPGESVETEPLIIAFGGRGMNMLQRWAKWVGQAMQARIPQRPPVGWCSWYYYYNRITEEDVLENLNHLADLKEELDLSFVQVDDGYQGNIGDWLTVGKRFPSGMEDMSSRIQSAGFSPGIWTAPFYARPGSNLVKNHPEWILRDAKDRPVKAGFNPLWGGKVLAFDPTHPGYQERLRKVYSSFYEMGYRYFKCDFLYAATLPAKRYDPRTTRAEALRIGLSVIREAIGEDSFLLGCGCPIQAAVGIVDGMRIGMDVTPKWSNKAMRNLLDDRNCLSTYHSIVNTINRSFMHNYLFANDPDCLLVRSDRNRMTLTEIQTLASVIALSGGILMISDNMANLTDERLDILRTAVSLRTDGMEVVDQFTTFEPRKLVARTSRGLMFGFLNFSDKPDTQIFDLKELMTMDELAAIRVIRDVWAKKELKHQNGLLRLANMQPHSARLIEVVVAQKGRSR